MYYIYHNIHRLSYYCFRCVQNLYKIRDSRKIFTKDGEITLSHLPLFFLSNGTTMMEKLEIVPKGDILTILNLLLELAVSECEFSIME